MDGLLRPEELQALEAQANLQQQEAQRRAMLSSLEKDAAMVARYSDLARQSQVQQPFATAYFGQLGPSSPIPQASVEAPAAERLKYAQKASEIERDMNRKIFPVQPDPFNTPPQAQPAPSEAAVPAPAPASPEPKQEQQPDIFADFKKQEEFRRGYWNLALEEMKFAPPSMRDKAIDVAEKIYKIISPKTPENIAVPLFDKLTGKQVEGYALIGGKVEKLEKGGLSPELSVIGYSGVAPTKEEAIKFRSELSEINSGLRDLDELITLGRLGSSLSPTQRARGQNLARMISGKFKQQIVGQGAVTENDRKILDQVVSNPLQIFTLVDIPQLLEDMKSRVISSRDERASTLGLTPINQKPQGQQQASGGGSIIYDNKGQRIK